MTRPIRWCGPARTGSSTSCTSHSASINCLPPCRTARTRNRSPPTMDCMTPAALAHFLESMSLSVPPLLLLLGACIGHGFMMIIGLNVLYARKLPHRLLKYTRKIDLLIILAGPIVFAYALDLFDSQRLSWEPG